jgi:hypothetical protein
VFDAERATGEITFQCIDVHRITTRRCHAAVFWHAETFPAIPVIEEQDRYNW